MFTPFKVKSTLKSVKSAARTLKAGVVFNVGEAVFMIFNVHSFQNQINIESREIRCADIESGAGCFNVGEAVFNGFQCSLLSKSNQH
jgi:hypothetical protein